MTELEATCFGIIGFIGVGITFLVCILFCDGSGGKEDVVERDVEERNM